MLFRDDIKLPVFWSHREKAVATKREQIFSVTLFSLWLCLGILLSSAIEHGENSHNLEYYQAAKISDDPVEFKESMQTDVGNAFVDGSFTAVEPVVHPAIGGKWLSIRAEYQSYEEHTRQVTYKDEDGQSRSRTETYWTWDTYRTDDVHAKSVEFLGQVFSYDKFNFDDIGTTRKTVDNGYHKRICVGASPATFRGAIYAVLKDGTLSHRKGKGKITVRENKTADALQEDSLETYRTIIFWSLWIPLAFVLVYAFYAIENRWLEN